MAMTFIIFSIPILKEILILHLYWRDYIENSCALYSCYHMPNQAGPDFRGGSRISKR